MTRRVVLCAALVGVAAGLAAVAFSAITGVASRLLLGGLLGYPATPLPAGEPQFPWPPLPPREFLPWLLLLLPAAGGLLSGLLTSKVAPETAGPGIDATLRAYHEEEGRIRGRVPFVKILATALTVGSGGSGGREGPIAQIGGGLGSWLAQLLNFSPAERRLLLAAGMGAGVAALFKAPVAGTIFAGEILYVTAAGEWPILLPAAIASLVAYGVYGAALGWTPLFRVPELAFSRPQEIGPQLLMVLAMVALARLYTFSFHRSTDVFGRLKLPAALKPALGAFLAGALGLVLYQAAGTGSLSVLSWGMNSLQSALDRDAAVGLLLLIALGKIATTALTLGSGGSGGLFGPAIVIGGCGGGALGLWLHGRWPTLAPQPEAYVILGMGAFFSAASKAPFSTLVIVCEVTGAWRLLPASALVCVMAFLLSGRDTLFKAQRDQPTSS